jgi:hypothetical protein
LSVLRHFGASVRLARESRGWSESRLCAEAWGCDGGSRLLKIREIESGLQIRLLVTDALKLCATLELDLNDAFSATPAEPAIAGSAVHRLMRSWSRLSTTGQEMLLRAAEHLARGGPPMAGEYIDS